MGLNYRRGNGDDKVAQRKTTAINGNITSKHDVTRHVT